MNNLRKIKIGKKMKAKIILLLILTTIGIVHFKINNYNTVKAGGRVRGVRMEGFWSGNRFYLLLERDDGGTRQYEISEKDYYTLKDEYVIVFMDGHIETLEEFKGMKELRENNVLNYIKSIWCLLYIIMMVVLILPWKRKHSKSKGTTHSVPT